MLLQILNILIFCGEPFAGNDCLKSGIIDINRDWVSSSVMLCQAFTAADFSCCLWVFLPLVLSSASEMHAQLGWDQAIDLAIAE